MPNVIVLSGFALLVSALPWAYGSLFHPSNFDPDTLINRYWKPVQIAQLVFFLLSVLGVIGLYLRQAEVVGIFGLIGFVLALFGSALNVATSIELAYPVPLIAQQSTPPKNLGDFMKPNGLLPWVFPLTGTYMLLFVPGYILLGLVTLSAGILPSLVGLLLIVGIVASLLGALVRPLVLLRKIGGLVFAVGLAWTGIALLS